MTRIFAVSLVTIAFWSAFCPAFSQQSAEHVVKKPYVTITGANSKIEAREYHRVVNKEQWTALWLRHLGRGDQEKYSLYYNREGVPLVDFESCMIIAVFQGRAWNSAGLKAHSLVELDDRIVFRFDDKCYQTGPKGDRVAVFGFFVVPKSTKLFILEENIQRIIARTPKWKEQHRFEALQSE